MTSEEWLGGLGISHQTLMIICGETKCHGEEVCTQDQDDFSLDRGLKFDAPRPNPRYTMRTYSEWETVVPFRRCLHGLRSRGSNAKPVLSNLKNESRSSDSVIGFWLNVLFGKGVQQRSRTDCSFCIITVQLHRKPSPKSNLGNASK
jgi:hypothetical protein